MASGRTGNGSRRRVKQPCRERQQGGSPSGDQIEERAVGDRRRSGVDDCPARGSDATPIGRTVVVPAVGSVYHRLNAIRVLSGDQTKSVSNQASDSSVRGRMSGAIRVHDTDMRYIHVGRLRRELKATIFPSGDQWTADRSC